MGKVYIFAIGGSGARVSRALTNLLISKNIENTEFVTVFFDNDLENGDVNLAINSIKKFNKTGKSLGLNTSKIALPDEIDLVSDKEASKVTFGTYIGYNDKDQSMSKMERSEKLLTESLFNSAQYNETERYKRELHLDMKHGFKGRPNIGCMVFNELKNKPEFKNIITDCASGNNKIVIVNSLFGGTGASGLPQLIQIFKDFQESGQYAGLENIPICAISFFPYFNVLKPTDNPDPDIDSSTWMTKAKSAAKYYIDNVTRLNSMYSLYDNPLQSYSYNDGGVQQLNPAHWIELMGAVAIIEFLMNKNVHSKTRCNNILISKSNNINIKSSEENFTVQNLQTSIKENYIKYILNTGLFWFLGNYYFKSNSDAPFINSIKDKYRNDLDKFELDFNYLTEEFIPYVKEMQTNKRALILFDFDTNDPFTFIFKKRKEGWIPAVNGFTKESKDLKTFIERVINYILN